MYDYDRTKAATNGPERGSVERLLYEASYTASNLRDMVGEAEPVAEALVSELERAKQRATRDEAKRVDKLLKAARKRVSQIRALQDAVFKELLSPLLEKPAGVRLRGR